ncbi:hypothetical protein E2C01_024298 [Portunus trituberculatus]|uniref:Uncharacterized protein n=1 Tax=Portunus trituberculatus TaxID=210409 RepID=A0A5B7ECC4_PORTR|nr:hypothetical protein [Portunus trituberculatus]
MEGLQSAAQVAVQPKHWKEVNIREEDVSYDAYLGQRACSSIGSGVIASKQLTTQQVAIILQESEVEVAEELNIIDNILVCQLSGEKGGQVPLSNQLPQLGPVAAPHLIQPNENNPRVEPGQNT